MYVIFFKYVTVVYAAGCINVCLDHRIVYLYDQKNFTIFFKKRHIGNTRLTVKKNEAILGIAIFDRRSQGQGFGSKALKIISDFSIKKLNIRTVKGGIDKKNFASIETFKKAGFLIKPNINIYNKSSRKYCLAIMKK